MLVHKTFRYELNPNDKQKTKFIQCCGVARFAYNWGLAQRIELYKTREGKERLTNGFKQQKEFTSLKKSLFPWLYKVHKSIPLAALQDLEDAYNDMHLNIIKHNKIVNVPKFKKKGVHDSFRVHNNHTERVKGTLRVEDNFVNIPKIGRIRIKESTIKFCGKILNATIIREADRWFCALVVECYLSETGQKTNSIIGIDLGLKCFATIYNGEFIQHIHSPKPLNNNIKKLKKLDRMLNRKKLKSNNRIKARLKLARLYKKIKDIRKDFLTKTTSELAKTKSVIVIEDLNVSGMMRNHHIARSIGDEGWGMFKEMLGYKTQWYGSKLIKINRFEPSSKTCHVCGFIKRDLKLDDRTWICPNCKAELDRDENAAMNIRRCGIEQLNTDSSSGINAYGVDVRPLVTMADYNEVGNKRLPFTEDKSYRTGWFMEMPLNCEVLKD